jgi:hypothetical protein
LRLPFTLIGNSIPSHALNWVWVWILGGLLSAPSIFLGACPTHLLLPSFVVGSLCTLSNINNTSDLFPWKMSEAFVGSSIAYPFALAISSR